VRADRVSQKIAVEASPRNATLIPAGIRPRPTGQDAEVNEFKPPRCRRRLKAAGLSACFSILAIENAGASNAGAGKAFAQANCSHCHSIDKFTQSPLAIAPPFRILHQRYPVESLEEALGEGIVTGHPSMPEFRLDPGQIGDFISFLKLLEQ
jgi:mono/diheme cytochrome c family protein